MARVGFKKTYAANAIDNAAITALFDTIKTYIVNAGFTIIENSATVLDFLPAGHAAGVINDDVAHWAFEFTNDYGVAQINAHGVYGPSFADVSSRKQWTDLADAGLVGPPATTLWFAADALEGWWWTASQQEDSYSSTGVSMRFNHIGASTRRYPSDNFQGLCARYGIWGYQNSWQPPYCLNELGEINQPYFTTWSALGQGGQTKRHPGSPMAKMAAPIFPGRKSGITLCIPGEFKEVMMITDGYAHGQTVIPGWMAITGGDYDVPYAVPSPDTFDQL